MVNILNNITKTYLYNFDPLKPHFYIVKLGFTGVYIIFLFSAQKHSLWYSLEPPRWGGSNECPQSMFWAEIWKISEFLIWKISVFQVQFSIYLNRHVFVMKWYFVTMWWLNYPSGHMTIIRHINIDTSTLMWRCLNVMPSRRRHCEVV